MALDTTIQQQLAANMLDEITALLDAETLGALIEVRTGAPTATTEEADTGTILAHLVCSTTSFPAATAAATATMAANAITSDTSAPATGEAGHFTAGSSATTDTMTSKVINGVAGVSGDTPDLTFDDDMIVIGGTVAITAWTINMPTN